MQKIKQIRLFGILNIFFFMSITASSQDYQVINLDELVTSPEKFSGSLDKTEVEKIQKLMYDLNPTIFISNSGSRIFGDEAPVKAEAGTNNFQALKTANPGFQRVKLLKLKIDEAADLNPSLDLNSLSGFKNLQYVVVECTFECSLTRIKNMFSNVKNVMVLYIVATPE